MSEPPIPDGFEIVNVPLHEVQFLPKTRRQVRYPDGRYVDFYETAPDQFVKVYVDGKVAWAPVAGFSSHPGLEVVVVNLSNGSQIVTDHDPRAVFGVAPGEVEPRRFYPDEALRLGVLVPCEIPAGMASWGGEPLLGTFERIWDALGRKAQIMETCKKGSRVVWDTASARWLLVGKDLTGGVEPGTGVSWAAVVDVDYTGQKEDGYDLTVPGYETFMSLDGVILSNTMNLHVPADEDSIRDAYDKLMPSKMVWSIKDPDKVVPTPKHEMVLQLYKSSVTPASARHRFTTEAEALQAIQDGKVKLEDDIDIGPPENGLPNGIVA